MIDHNAYNVLLPQDYDDYLLHVETETGRKRTYKRFLKRVQDAATVLTSSAEEGGADIRIDNDELVGIMSHNTMVGFKLWPSIPRPHEPILGL